MANPRNGEKNKLVLVFGLYFDVAKGDAPPPPPPGKVLKNIAPDAPVRLV